MGWSLSSYHGNNIFFSLIISARIISSVAAAPAQSQLKPEAEPSLAEAQPELPSGGSHISAKKPAGAG